MYTALRMVRWTCTKPCYSDPDTVIWKKLAEMYGVTVDDLMGVERKYPFNASELEVNWPELVQVLRTHGKLATPAERRRIGRVVRACLEEDVENN